MSLKISIIISCWNDGSHSEIITMSSNPNLYKVPMTSYSYVFYFILLLCANLIQWGESCHMLHQREGTFWDGRWATPQKQAGSQCPHPKPGCRCCASLSGETYTICFVLPWSFGLFYVPWQLLASMFEQIRNFLFHLTWACFFSSCSSSPLCQRM